MATMPPFFEVSRLIWSFKICLPLYDQFAQKLRAIILKYKVPPPVIFTLSIQGNRSFDASAHMRRNFNLTIEARLNLKTDCHDYFSFPFLILVLIPVFLSFSPISADLPFHPGVMPLVVAFAVGECQSSQCPPCSTLYRIYSYEQLARSLFRQLPELLMQHSQLHSSHLNTSKLTLLLAAIPADYVAGGNAIKPDSPSA